MAKTATHVSKTTGAVYNKVTYPNKTYKAFVCYRVVGNSQVRVRIQLTNKTKKYVGMFSNLASLLNWGKVKDPTTDPHISIDVDKFNLEKALAKAMLALSPSSAQLELEEKEMPKHDKDPFDKNAFAMVSEGKISGADCDELAENGLPLDMGKGMVYVPGCDCENCQKHFEQYKYMLKKGAA